MWETRPGAGTLVVRNDQVLMVLRERSGVVRWELPSGFVEAGESFEQTAIRETLEETGVHVELGDLVCTVTMIVPDEEYRAVNLYYRAITGEEQEPHILAQSEPIEDVAFVKVAKLDPDQIHPVDREILKRWHSTVHPVPFCFTITL